MNRFLVLAVMSILAAQGHAGDKCIAARERVATGDFKQITQWEFENCRGPIIAAAACKGWRQGKSEQGCKDRQTSALWAKSNDPTIRSKGEACLAGESLDLQCGLH